MNIKAQIEKIKKGKIWKFFGGIHPKEMKDTASIAIAETKIPALITLPLDRHLGTNGEIIVSVGEYVKKGQSLTIPGGNRLVPLHASTSGTITAIAPEVLPHPSGFSGTCITIKPDGLDEEIPPSPWTDYKSHSSDELLERIRSFGVEGLGGAQFQTATKLKSGRDDCIYGCRFFIVNGCECEPVITCNDRLMQEMASEIVEGIKVVQHILKPELTIIAIENNKENAIAAMKKAIEGLDNVQVRVLPVVYPSGAARNLIRIVTGQEVPYDVHTSDIGIVVNNVETVLAIKQAVIDGRPLTSRVVTVAGGRLKKPKNLRVRLGTSVRFLLNACNLEPEYQQRIILGGPMMGFTINNIDVPVTKSIGCIMAPSKDEIPLPTEELNCLRCGRCARVCPSRLVPYQMYQQSKAGNHAAAQMCGISDCTECGCCSYVCPSHIHLTAQFRYEKAVEKHLAEVERRNLRARQRMQAHDERMEKERKAREAKKAAALARINAQKLGQTPEGKPLSQDDAIALARKAALERKRRLLDGKQNGEKKIIDKVDETISDADRNPDRSAITKLSVRSAIESPVEIKIKAIKKVAKPLITPEITAENNSTDETCNEIPRALRRSGGRKVINIVEPVKANTFETDASPSIGRTSHNENLDKDIMENNEVNEGRKANGIPQALLKKSLRNRR